MPEKPDMQGIAPPTGPDEDVDLEYYELRDEAVKRVAVKASVKIHFAVWLVINIFLVILNLYLVNFQVRALEDFWVFWTLIPWGFGVYVHATVWFTINVKHLGKRMFFIHFLVGVGLVPFVATINLMTMPSYLWFWWVLGAEIAFILLHYYITFISTRPHVDRAIKREMEVLKRQKERKS